MTAAWVSIGVLPTHLPDARDCDSQDSSGIIEFFGFRRISLFYFLGVIIDGAVYNHCWRADNLWLFVADMKQLTVLCQEATDAIYSLRFTWKSSSFETMSARGSLETPLGLSVTTPSGEILDYVQVEEIGCRGTCLNRYGCSFVSMRHRTCQAERNFWANVKAFLGPVPVSQKIAGRTEAGTVSFCYMRF